MPQMGVDVPDEVMVALSERRISLLLDHQAARPVSAGPTWSGCYRNHDVYGRIGVG